MGDAGLHVRLMSWAARPRLIYLWLHFPERSCLAPQLKHSHSLTERSNFPAENPQHEHFCDVGSHLLITLKSRPYFSAFPSKKVLNCRQPKSDMALDNFRFFTIPDTFKSTKTITWFSLIISVDNLCRKSVKRVFQFGMKFSYF